MEKALAPLRERLRKVRPWAGVAIVAAVVLVGYAGLQGRTYLTATSDEDAAVARLAQLTNVVRQLNDAVGSDEEAAKAKREADVETRKSVLQDWKDEFHVSGYPTTTDPLLGTVFDVATRSGVGLNQINIMDTETY